MQSGTAINSTELQPVNTPYYCCFALMAEMQSLEEHEMGVMVPMLGQVEERHRNQARRNGRNYWLELLWWLIWIVGRVFPTLVVILLFVALLLVIAHFVGKSMNWFDLF